MTNHCGLSHSVCESSASFLKQLLANTYVLYLKTQNFHWNVTGPHFSSLHLLFESQYEELAEAVDEIAECIRGLGILAPGTFAEFLNLATLKEAISVTDAMSMVLELAEDHEAIARECRQAQSMLSANDDISNADLLVRRVAVHHKTSWMLRMHLSENG